MNRELDQLIRAVSLDGRPLQDLDYDAASGTWWTAVLVEDADGQDAVGFELEFQHVRPEDGPTPAYLVVSWVVIPPDEMRAKPADDPALLQALNDLNGEPGAKFRLHTDERGATSLVCESELFADGLTPAALQRAVERGRDLVAAYFDDIQNIARG